MRTGIKTAVVLLLAVSIISACAPRQVEQPPHAVVVQLAWYHSANFGGFYAADQQGYYAEEGLEVALTPRSEPAADVIAPVVDGTADFGVDYGAGLLIARSQGRLVTAIATLFPHHPL